MQEEWRPVVGYDGYEVSNFGRVRSLPKPGQHKRTIIMKTFSLPSGYSVVTFCGRKKELVHRVVASAFIPNERKLPIVNHLDGDKTNNMVSNLEWCTSKENCRHSVEKLGNRPGKEPKRVKCLDDGRIYRSVKEAAEAVGVKPITVYVQIKSGGLCGGKRFMFCMN